VAATLVESGVFDTYVVYERPGGLCFAADPAVQVTLRGQRILRTVAGETREWPCADRPFQRVGAVLNAELAANRTAYGYAAFELASPAPLGDTDDVLFDAIVPETEVVATGRELVVRCGSEVRLALVTELVRAAGAGWDRFDAPARPADIDTVASRAAYEALVADAVAEIRRGELDKVILSRGVPCPFEVDLLRTYLRGRRHNTPARSFLLRLGQVRALGFSPEIVVTVGADRTVTTEPLAGTRAFGAGGAMDAELRADLLSDPKEVYEHAVSVRTALDELRQVCVSGSIALDDFMGVRERGSVQHLASSLRGTLRPRLSGWDVFDAVFPAVTASGIPKRQAYGLIRRFEPEPRRMYGGAVFAAAADGSLDSALVLRALIDDGRGPRLRAGAGIVGTSSPAREYVETCEKLRSVAEHLVPLVPEEQAEDRRVGMTAERGVR